MLGCKSNPVFCKLISHPSITREPMKFNKLNCLAFAISMTLSGCGTIQNGSNSLKADVVEPAPDAGFIEHPERQSKHADLPFQKVWIKPGFDKLYGV